jgi:hypothetical protein
MERPPDPPAAPGGTPSREELHAHMQRILSDMRRSLYSSSPVSPATKLPPTGPPPGDPGRLTR